MDLNIPRAKGFDVKFCGHCPHAHVIFKDKDDLPICQAVLGLENLRSIAEEIYARDPNFREEV